jgi:multidrug efflux pump subunit AcrA (membrane-fusion protein)
MLRHAADSISSALRGFLRKGGYGRKAVAAASVVLALWLVFGKLEYRLAVTAAVTPAELRHISTPYDAVLASVAKFPGDHVRKGEVLCQLDKRELELQQAELKAEMAVAEQETQRAMATKTPVDARLAQMQVNLACARHAVVTNRIERATIVSPIDGVLVEGDLRTKVGSVMPQGTPLFQVAPAEAWRLELRIPDGSSSDIQGGLCGRFACQARPDAVQTFQLKRLQPSAVVYDKQTVFVAEAQLSEPEAWLRPGMEGVAKINMGRRPAWWVLFHTATDYIRMKLWL